jgi:hypothetical protein
MSMINLLFTWRSWLTVCRRCYNRHGSRYAINGAARPNSGPTLESAHFIHPNFQDDLTRITNPQNKNR